MICSRHLLDHTSALARRGRDRNQAPGSRQGRSQDEEGALSDTMDWFENITGFREDGYEGTRSRLTVEGGQYASTSEIVREALREWTRSRDSEQRDLRALREAVKLGDESGPSIPADEVFTELRRMIAKRRATTG